MSRDRRTSRAKYAPRALAAAVDAFCTLGLSACVNFVLATGFWSAAGVLSMLYFGMTTIMLGATPGSRVAEAVRQRMPSLFAVPDRRRATA
jgi:hypothetical protein